LGLVVGRAAVGLLKAELILQKAGLHLSEIKQSNVLTNKIANFN